MNRRWLPALEALLLLGVLAWVAFALLRPVQGPEGAIDLKVQLVGAEDRVWLHRGEDGQLRYQVTAHDGAVAQLDPLAFSERLHREQSSRGILESVLNVSSPVGFVWVALGFLGQLLFTGRMLVQWIASERSRKSVVPEAFWWMSLVGASMLLAYFVWRRDPVGVLGQATGWFVYLRNLWFLRTARVDAALREQG
ncbi:MAG: hypothetical protein RL148_579 [Planctomycetota bacterium]|jgi:lipid-A-disaccharide synthase-like uncharacterized protein